MIPLVLKSSLSGYIRISNCVTANTVIPYYTERLATLYKMQKGIDSGGPPSVRGPGLQPMLP